MAKFNIKKIIDANTTDDTVNYEAVNKELETQNKNVVAKEIEKELAKVDKDTIIKEFLMDNDFKSLDDFTAFQKNGATPDTEAVKRIEKERDDFEKLYKDLLPLSNELATYKNQSLLRGKGTLTQDELEFYEYKINKLDGDTFEDKFNAFVETNPDVFKEGAPANVIKTTGTKTGTVIKQGDKAGFETILEDKYPNLKL